MSFRIRSALPLFFINWRTFPKMQMRSFVIKISSFAFASASAFYLYNIKFPRKFIYSDYVVQSQTDEPTSENPTVAMFEKFASVEFDGEAFMTPRDFVDCITGARPPVAMRRHVVDETIVNKILAHTPAIGSCRVSLFKKLDRNGLISCSEFLFLLSVLTGSLHKLQVLFMMFDRDDSGRIERPEFLQMTNLCQLKFSKEATLCEATTLLRHFFNKDGSGTLAYKDFTKFMTDLQKEILSAEFNRLSMGTDAISRLKMAEVILRYSKTSPTAKEAGYQKVAESVAFESDSITFQSYCEFFTLLYDYEDFSAALKMFLQTRRTISEDEFQRAARAVTGKFLDKAIVDTVFLLFDADGDGHLSPDEFMSFIRSYIARGTRNELTSESAAQNFSSCVATRVRAT
uniref:Calcium uptake protein 2 n=1 Tax=Schistocephalus solidus TaxID=70667 RepID=A0A0X3PW16_SCHSO